MSDYNQQQALPGVPPPQGYPQVGYPSAGYPRPPSPGYAPQYIQQAPAKKEVGFLEGYLAALCCSCVLECCF